MSIGYMFRKKPVKTLEKAALNSLHVYLKDHCWTVSRLFGGTDMDQIVKREEVLWLHIEELRDFIFSHVSWSMQETVVDEIISAVNEAAEEKKRQYSINTNIATYKTELYCMVKMIELVVSPNIRKLNMPVIPKILRTHITGNLRYFTGLRYLDMLLLGFGRESRRVDVTEVVAPGNVIDALRGMSHLTHVILPTFCTNNIINALARTCKDTLKKLEIDHCEHISNAAADYLIKLENLELLSICETRMEAPYLAKVIFGLHKLKNLPEAGFLCDTLEWMESEESESIWPKGLPNPILKIQEFYPSDEYHFHTRKQIETVQAFCPFIRDVRFFYDGEMLCEVGVLANFSCLTQLKLNGGDFSKDPLGEFFEGVGFQLTKLELNHVENIDRTVISQLALSCPNLESLFLSACSFLDYGELYRELFDYFHSGSLDTTEELELASLLRDQEAASDQIERLIHPFQSLVNLRVSSQCSRKCLIFLILHCPNITSLCLGLNPDLSDEVISQLVSAHCLTRLESLTILGNDHLTRNSIDLILSSCPNIRELKGLPYWRGLPEKDLADFETWLLENNIDLDIKEMEPVDNYFFFNKNEFLDEKQKEEYRIFFSTD